MALSQDGDDPPEGTCQALRQDQPRRPNQNAAGPAAQGVAMPPLEQNAAGPAAGPAAGSAAHGVAMPPLDLDPTHQGGHEAPSTTSKTFPDCGHVISGSLLRDLGTAKDQSCPVCKTGPFPGKMKFGPCGHVIYGDAVRQVIESRTSQCPVCMPPSGDNLNVATTDAHSHPTNPTETIAHNERSRVTLNKYRDPYTFEGVIGDVYFGKDGRARLRVKPEVWKSWPKPKRDQFVYSTNVRFGQPVGEDSPAPTNTGNPNHPAYIPGSTASNLWHSMDMRNRPMSAPPTRRVPDPAAAAEAVRRLLATPDRDVVRHSLASNLRAVEAATSNQPQEPATAPEEAEGGSVAWLWSYLP